MEQATPIKDLENWLTPELSRMLLSQAALKNKRDWLLMFCLLRTGRRISELLMLRPSHLNVNENMILWYIEKKKAIVRKWKAIDTECFNELINYINKNNILPDEYVFFSPIKGRNYHLTRVACWYIIKKYSKNIGLNNVHPHTFRHTFAVWFAKVMNSPSDLKKLKDYLEHSDIRMTEVYLQFNPKETKELLEKTFKIEN